MKITKTNLEGCFVVEQSVFKDERGLFYEAYNKKIFEDLLGVSVDFVQDNVSISKKGVLRGLHFQKGKQAQSKLVRVLKGRALDVVVDCRKDSATFGHHFKMELSGKAHTSIFIPKGMAHGFLALSKEVVFAYKCNRYYNQESESGIRYNDPDLNIDWNYPEEEIILSDKDRQLLSFKELQL